MKTKRIATHLLSVTAVLLAGIVWAANQKGGDELVKITTVRLPMDKRILKSCVGPAYIVGPHDSAEVDIYVNNQVLEYRKANPEKYDYPVGSKFVKKKYPKPGAKNPDLATIMVRKELKGVVSDWEFTMESLPDHKPIIPTGRISCASCHERYEERGFISRESETVLRQYLKLGDGNKAAQADDLIDRVK